MVEAQEYNQQQVVIFDIFTTLLKVDSEGKICTHYQAMESLQELKSNRSVKVFAVCNPER